MPRSSLEDPLKTSKFQVEIDGFARAGFSFCGALEAETEVIEYREGGDNDQPRLSAGQTKYSPIVLRRGITEKSQNGTFDMFDWRDEVHGADRNGRQAIDYRRDVDIVLLNRDGSTGARFRVFNAWPSSYKTTDLDGSATNEVAIEEMELQNEGWIRVA